MGRKSEDEHGAKKKIFINFRISGDLPAPSFSCQLTEKLVSFSICAVEGNRVNGDWVQQLHLGQNGRWRLKEKEKTTGHPFEKLNWTKPDPVDYNQISFLLKIIE